MTTIQQFSTQPQAAPSGKKKQNYRDDDTPDHLNLMNDPRVARGSTHTPKVMNTQKTKSAMNRTVAPPGASRTRIHVNSLTKSMNTNRNTTTFNASEFLEELTDRPIEIDAEPQTKTVVDRPRSPLFVQARIGKDAQTQIAAGDLFDFDLEVVPYLEVLVGRTLHVALMEVKQEDEIENIFKRQREFEQIRNVELAEVQRLEAEQQRRLDEQIRRHTQEEKRVEDKKARENTVSAKLFANEYLADLHGNVLDSLEGKGHFKDPLEHEIKEQYLKNLAPKIHLNVDNHRIACSIADDLFADALKRVRDQSIAAGFVDEEAPPKEPELIL